MTIGLYWIRARPTKTSKTVYTFLQKGRIKCMIDFRSSKKILESSSRYGFFFRVPFVFLGIFSLAL